VSRPRAAWRAWVAGWGRAFGWLSGDRKFREAMHENRVASLDALRRYDAEHGTSLARLAADPERWRS
jgi:hypothetical protein